MFRKNQSASDAHRFAVEELLDAVVRSRSSDAPAPVKAGRSVPSESGGEGKQADELPYDVRRTSEKR